jgi:hypothetical protein
LAILIKIRGYFNLFYEMEKLGNLDIGLWVTLDYLHNGRLIFVENVLDPMVVMIWVYLLTVTCFAFCENF